jgi:hypothetical protein
MAPGVIANQVAASVHLPHQIGLLSCILAD